MAKITLGRSCALAAAGPIAPALARPAPLLRTLASLTLGVPTARPLASLLGGLGAPRRWRFATASITSDAEQPSTTAATTTAAAEQPSEAEDFVVINFYHLVDIPRPHEVIENHKEFLAAYDVRGRIYFSEQGVNAQFGGPRSAAVAYAEWATSQPPLEGVQYEIKMDVTEGHQFPRMRIQYKPNLISLAGGMSTLPVTDPTSRATPLSPTEWRAFLEKGTPDGKKPLVLDVRNSYEWDAGHFVGAQRPLEEEFNETPTEALPVDVPPYLREVDPDTPVMMYCTGGIRCDVYSTYLKAKGYTNLYSLEYGIQNYMKEQGTAQWNGSCYVFDGRMAIRQEGEEELPLVAAAPCAVCGGEAELPHANCANIDCNKLFIACGACKGKLSGCCCEACMSAPRLLRPVKEAGQYGTWRQYASEDEGASAISKGRGEGRIARRRKRQQALKDKEQARRAEKLERRREAKAALAAREDQMERDGEQSEAAAAAERMARLRELRERLAAGSAV